MSSFRCGTATARGQASLGGSSTRVGRPGRKEPGTPEGVPRTTAITRHRGHKKSACDEDWALLRLSIPTGQGRIADASATGAIYPYVPPFASTCGLYGATRLVGRKLTDMRGSVDSGRIVVHLLRFTAARFGGANYWQAMPKKCAFAVLAEHSQRFALKEQTTHVRQIYSLSGECLTFSKHKKGLHRCKPSYVVPETGIEPATFALRVRCSTD